MSRLVCGQHLMIVVLSSMSAWSISEDSRTLIWFVKVKAPFAIGDSVIELYIKHTLRFSRIRANKVVVKWTYKRKQTMLDFKKHSFVRH